jgi:hypothetical protein
MINYANYFKEIARCHRMPPPHKKRLFGTSKDSSARRSDALPSCRSSRSDSPSSASVSSLCWLPDINSPNLPSPVETVRAFLFSGGFYKTCLNARGEVMVLFGYLPKERLLIVHPDRSYEVWRWGFILREGLDCFKRLEKCVSRS